MLREPVGKVVLARELLAAHEHHVLEEVADALEAAGSVGEEADIEIDGARRELHARARPVVRFVVFAIFVRIVIIIFLARLALFALLAAAVRAGVVVHRVLVAVPRGLHTRLSMWVGIDGSVNAWGSRWDGSETRDPRRPAAADSDGLKSKHPTRGDRGMGRAPGWDR